MLGIKLVRKKVLESSWILYAQIGIVYKRQKFATA
jgi:hypothetical protein